MLFTKKHLDETQLRRENDALRGYLSEASPYTFAGRGSADPAVWAEYSRAFETRFPSGELSLEDAHGFVVCYLEDMSDEYAKIFGGELTIIRRTYLDRLIAFQDKDLIKVVTGIRRCGKSTLLQMMAQYLIDSGVPQKRVFMFKMESMELAGLRDYRALYDLVCQKIQGIENPYLLLRSSCHLGMLRRTASAAMSCSTPRAK